MEPHSPNNFVIYSINAKYLGSNIWHTPVYDSYMQNITGGDEVLKLRFLQVAGYILTPDTSAKKYFAFQGEKDSGKSIFVHLIENLFPDSATEPLPAHSYGERFSIGSLYGKLLTVSSDMPATALDSSSVGVIKQITGNDDISSHAYERYRQEGGVCSENVFAQYFTRACEELYKTQRTRKRKVGEGNPRWGLLGIKFIISDFR